MKQVQRMIKADDFLPAQASGGSAETLSSACVSSVNSTAIMGAFASAADHFVFPYILLTTSFENCKKSC